MSILNLNTVSETKMEDIDELISTIGHVKQIDSYETQKQNTLRPSPNGTFTFTNVLQLITSDIHNFRCLISFQKHLAQVTFGYDKWRDIKRRKQQMIEVWKYRETHCGESPKESIFHRISRLVSGEAKPYQYDYEIIPCNINKYMQDIIDYFHSLYHPFNINDIPPEDRRISQLKKIGSTYTMERPLESMDYTSLNNVYSSSTSQSLNTATSLLGPNVSPINVKRYLCAGIQEDVADEEGNYNENYPNNSNNSNNTNENNENNNMTCPSPPINLNSFDNYCNEPIIIPPVDISTPISRSPGTRSRRLSGDTPFSVVSSPIQPCASPSRSLSPLVPVDEINQSTRASLRRLSGNSRSQLASCPHSLRGKQYVIPGMVE